MRFTWRQKNPIIQRRLDFWLISSSTQEEVVSVDIIPAIRTSFWKFNSSLLEDEEYIKLITDKYSYWLEEGKVLRDPRVLWDFIKYQIRYETIFYSKQKARNRREPLTTLEEKIKELMYNKM